MLHGFRIRDIDGANQLSFAFDRFLGAIWTNQAAAFHRPRHTWPYRRIDRRFVQLSTKALDTTWKVLRVAELYSRAFSTYGRAAITDEIPPIPTRDMSIHLDSLLVYLRVLADLV